MKTPDDVARCDGGPIGGGCRARHYCNRYIAGYAGYNDPRRVIFAVFEPEQAEECYGFVDIRTEAPSP